MEARSKQAKNNFKSRTKNPQQNLTTLNYFVCVVKQMYSMGGKKGDKSFLN